MRNILYDTSVYIPLLREGRSILPSQDLPQVAFYLSSVVLQELYAGVLDLFSKKLLDQFYETFRKYNRVITPNEGEWRECGNVLSVIGQKHGYDWIRKGRLVNDVLIAISCRRAGAGLLTYNHKDFQVIQQVVPFDLVK